MLLAVQHSWLLPLLQTVIPVSCILLSQLLSDWSMDYSFSITWELKRTRFRPHPKLTQFESAVYQESQVSLGYLRGTARYFWKTHLSRV